MVAAAADNNPVGAWSTVSIQRQLALGSVALSFILSTGVFTGAHATTPLGLGGNRTEYLRCLG